MFKWILGSLHPVTKHRPWLSRYQSSHSYFDLVLFRVSAPFPRPGALLQLPPRSVTEALAYMSSRDLLSAAVRLNLIGPLAAVALQARVAVTAADVAARASTRPREEAATAAPMLECIHVSHDLLDHRIFQT
eukprot:6185632-Pleurochrysis_carterae.AAC.2